MCVWPDRRWKEGGGAMLLLLMSLLAAAIVTTDNVIYTLCVSVALLYCVAVIALGVAAAFLSPAAAAVVAAPPVIELLLAMWVDPDMCVFCLLRTTHCTLLCLHTCLILHRTKMCILLQYRLVLCGKFGLSARARTMMPLFVHFASLLSVAAFVNASQRSIGDRERGRGGNWQSPPPEDVCVWSVVYSVRTYQYHPERLLRSCNNLISDHFTLSLFRISM